MLARYLLRRIVHAALLLVAVSVLSFLLLSLAPGDFFDESRLNPSISAETIQALRVQYGLTQPLPARYFYWIKSLARGEFGLSFAYGMPVWKLMAPRIRNTLALTSASLLLSWCIALALGIWSAARRGGWLDRTTSVAGAALLATPEIVLASLLLLLALAGGYLSIGRAVLPVAALVLAAAPVLARHVKSAMLHTADAPFVRAARAHGLCGRRLWLGQILPVAANPLVSLFGLSVAALLSSSLVVEVIFAWPGLGPLLLEAIQSRDVYLILGPVMLSTALLAAATLLADLLLFWCDPRIRVER